MLLSIHPDHPEPRKIRQAIDALEAGGVIACPTDSIYALCCDSAKKGAVERLYAIKGVARSHPMAFICPDLSDVARYAIVDKPVYRVLRHFLPGPYTFILEATREVPKLLRTRRQHVGIRVPGCEAVRALARELGRAILSSSARREGQEPLVDPREIDHDFRGLALVLDGGVGGIVPTTVVDLTKTPVEIVREGAGPVDELRSP